MWTIYRKVQNESATGSSTSHRVRTTLTLRVETVDFDTQACLLRLKGRNIEENDYVKVSLIFFVKIFLKKKTNNNIDIICLLIVVVKKSDVRSLRGHLLLAAGET